jgi:hypothetical protein
MIPQRRLIRTGFGNGVSCRVVACRRRLRSIRANETQSRLEEQGAESSSSAVEPRGRTDTIEFMKQGQDEAEIT